MNKEEQNMNNAENSKLSIFDVMYRLFWYSLFLIVPYLFISLLWMDIWWMEHHLLTRLLYWGWSVMCFLPCVLLGVWTPKGMEDVK